MNRIFISHSTADKAVAVAMSRRLQDAGYQIFLDSDPGAGIPAGNEWKQEIHLQIRSSRAMVVLCSRHSMDSPSCSFEIGYATSMGKRLFPVQLDGCEIHGLLSDRQVVDLQAGEEEAYACLLDALGDAPQVWDGARRAFPGFPAFEEEDEPIFFGREEEIAKGLDLLGRVREHRDAGLVMVLGASGSGKSSLVRAGLLPRLRRDGERWLVIDPMRPLDDPFRELAVVLLRVLGEDETEWAGLRKELWRAAEDLPAEGTKLDEVVQRLRLRGNVQSDVRSEVRILLIVVQFEELLGEERGPARIKNHRGSRSPALRYACLKAVVREPREIRECDLVSGIRKELHKEGKFLGRGG